MSTILWVIVICGLIGVADTVYLIYHKITGTDVACWFFPKEWCHKVQYSKYSKTFGIPNAYAGLAMYAALLLLVLMNIQGVASLGPLQLVITIGFLFSLYFTFIQAFVLQAFCTWCVISTLNFIVMFVVAFTK